MSAGHAADELGGLVVLKATGLNIVHKTELGAVEMGLLGGDDVARAARRMARRLRAAGTRHERFTVQRQLTGGVEMLAGITSIHCSARSSLAEPAGRLSRCSATSR